MEKSIFDTMLIGFDTAWRKGLTDFPPYNIKKPTDTDYILELACAGYSKEDLSVSVTNKILTVSGNKHSADDIGIVYKGISSKSFKKSFTLAVDVIVDSAEYTNGILTIRLKQIPQTGGVKQIAIA